MFATTQLIAMSLGFPDVCKTLIGIVVTPIPYPNIAMALAHIPNNINQFFAAGSVHNLLTPGTISQGDTVGVLMGVVSQLIMGPNRYVLGSFKVIIGIAPGARLTSLTAQNGTSPNAVGATLTPSINRVMFLG